MVALEGAELAEIHDAQDRGDHALAGSQDGPCDHHEGLLSHPPGEDGSESRETGHNVGRQSKQRSPLCER
jgi:hypothetical protein